MERPRTYFLVYLTLVLLLGLAVAAAYAELGPLAAVANISLAVVKAVLVLLFFMHLRHSSYLTWVFVIAGFAWLSLLLGITWADFVARPLEAGLRGTTGLPSP